MLSFPLSSLPELTWAPTMIAGLSTAFNALALRDIGSQTAAVALTYAAIGLGAAMLSLAAYVGVANTTSTPLQTSLIQVPHLNSIFILELLQFESTVVVDVAAEPAHRPI